jgi:hypothetical protein
LILLGAIKFVWRFAEDKPKDYASIAEHFKYGSINSSRTGGGSLSIRSAPLPIASTPTPTPFPSISTRCIRTRGIASSPFAKSLAMLINRWMPFGPGHPMYTTVRCPRCATLRSHRSNAPGLFSRGDDLYDQKKVGFVSNVAKANRRRFTTYDTSLPGNHHGGHVYGIHLTPEQKDALIEYMKTL